MRVGIYADLRNPPAWATPWPEHYAYWLELATEADRLGADSLWLSEHHFFDDGYLPQPLTFAAAVAARTTRVRIGTAVLLAGLRRGVQLAEESAIVDILSNGRLDLGVGVGYRPAEYEAYGADITQRYVLLERVVREIREWWTGAVLQPPPVAGEVPVWGGFFGPRGARLAGRLGMGLLPHPAVARKLMEPYTAGLVEAGKTVADARMRINLPFMLAVDPDEAQREVVPYLDYQRDSYRRHGFETGAARSSSSSDAPALRGPAGAGYRILTPADAADYVRSATAGLPVDEVFCWASVGGMARARSERHVELLCTQLRPLLAGWEPTVEVTAG